MSRGEETISAVVSSTASTAMVLGKKECYDAGDDFAISSTTSDDKEDDEQPTAAVEVVETRLDICASLFAPMSESEKEAYINNLALTADLLAKSLPPRLQTLILWHFPSLSSNKFAAALRLQSSLQRLTLNFACRSTESHLSQQRLTWGCLDVVAMACACMEQLRVLQIRCVPRSSDHHIASKVLQHDDAIISPEAIVVLLNSPTIKQLYLENCGLIDDHMDEIYNELPKNKTLTMLDLKGNMFTDDCLHTMSRLLPIAPPQLQYLDISGVSINDAAGKAVAMGMIQNHTLQSFEIEGTIQRYQDEFDIPVGHSDSDWMQLVTHQLRLNRAYQVAYDALSQTNRPKCADGSNTSAVTFADKQTVVRKDVASFVAAVSSVSDSASCLYHFLRSYPDHCNRLTVPLPHVEPQE